MTQPDPETQTQDALHPVVATESSDFLAGLFDDDVFAATAWAPNPNWSDQPLTQEQFAERLYEMGKAGDHELRALVLLRYSESLAGRLGADHLAVSLGQETAYEPTDAGASLKLDYRTSLFGDTPNEQLNAYVGLLIRGVGEHLANTPESPVAQFIAEARADLGKFRVGTLGSYVEQTAITSVVDRAISAQVAEDYPGFSKLGLDGLYQLTAKSSEQFFKEAAEAIRSGKNKQGEHLDREALKKLELEMASQYLQTETTAPGLTYVSPAEFPWAGDIEQAAMMFRNITNLTTDHDFAKKGSERYAQVVERILDLPEAPPEPEAGAGGLPNLGALQAHHDSVAEAGQSAESAEAPKSTLDKVKDVPTDSTVKWDQQKFERLVDKEVELCNERTPWAEGNPTSEYVLTTAKAGPVARARYSAIRVNYAREIRELREVLQTAFEERPVVEHGRSSGRPDGRRLIGTLFGQTNVFKFQTVETDAAPIDVVVLIDESGSMSAGCQAEGYREVPNFVGGMGYGHSSGRHAELGGTGADQNKNAEEGGGTRIDVAKRFGVILQEALRGLPGVRFRTYGYASGSVQEFGVTTKGGGYGASIVRLLGTTDEPHAVALATAYGGNGDKEALIQAIKDLEKWKNDGARQAVVYLADGGITDSRLEELLKNLQRRMPVFFVDMSGSVRGTGGSLKIKHHVPVNSMRQGVKAIGKFFKDIVLEAA